MAGLSAANTENKSGYWRQWADAGTEGYDRPAQEYDQRLAAASSAEEARARELWQRNRAASEAQLAQQTALTQRDIAGAGASGGGPSMLRAAAYGSGQVAQQASTEGALQKQMEDQAMREQMAQMYGRRGEYGMWGQQFAADQYGAWAEQEAYNKKREAEEAGKDQRDAAAAVGMIGGFIGGGITGGT